ncbi:hypothetical protein NDU88_008107 [Pleurodeles waltl]|uniref:Uncharacterized protein n=1 Tax=Pleurodeles waltl TaxID=8319 RepID=A0AAV7QMS2_PLEWA|nr:hypothetical protein NDU88_008107 [Pleurodeles waltl]
MEDLLDVEETLPGRKRIVKKSHMMDWRFGAGSSSEEFSSWGLLKSVLTNQIFLLCHVIFANANVVANNCCLEYRK